MNNDPLSIHPAIMHELNEIQSSVPISNGNGELSRSIMPRCNVLSGNQLTGGVQDFQFTVIQ